MIHGPSFRAGLAAAADFLRNVEGIKSVFGPHLAEQVLKLKPSHRSTKRTRARSQARATKAAKRETKAAETARIRAEVFARAGDKCELCGGLPTDLHHAFGRVRVKQAAANCLALCRHCHDEITNNKPDAASCWQDVADAFQRLGLRESEAMAGRKLDEAVADAAARERLAERRRAEMNTTQEGEAT